MTQRCLARTPAAAEGASLAASFTEDVLWLGKDAAVPLRFGVVSSQAGLLLQQVTEKAGWAGGWAAALWQESRGRGLDVPPAQMHVKYWDCRILRFVPLRREWMASWA